MTRHDLVHEQLTVLPKRFETRRFGRGGNINVALVAQNNYSEQVVFKSFAVAQYNTQVNIADIHQR